MSNNSYIAPNMQSNQYRNNRRGPRHSHGKPLWQVEKEKAELELEEKKKEAERGLEDTLVNFPTLGGIPNTTNSGTSSIWSGTRTFSELASEWKLKDEQKLEEEKIQIKDDDNHIFQLPQFRNIHKFSEPEDEYYEDENDSELDSQQIALPKEDEWTVVDYRKYRKPKPEFNFDDDDLLDTNEDEDNTQWATPAEHETCWDDRRF